MQALIRPSPEDALCPAPEQSSTSIMCRKVLRIPGYQSVASSSLSGLLCTHLTMAKACAFPSSGYQLTNFSKGSLFSHIAILSWLSFNFNFDLTPSRVCGAAAEFDSTVSIMSASKVRSTRRIISRNEWTDVPEAEPMGEVGEVGEVDETASGDVGV